MLKKLFSQICILSAITSPVLAVASLNFTNDTKQDVYALRINDEGYTIKGTGLIVPTEIQIAPGKTESFEIFHTPDENQPAFRQEKDQITEIRFDVKEDHDWLKYKCILPTKFNPNLNKDLNIKASSCNKVL